MESFVNHHQVSRFFEHFLILRGKESADIYEQIFLSADPNPVEMRTYFLKNLSDGFIRVSFLTLLYKISILNQAGSIEPHFNSVFLGILFQFLNISHRNRLAACHVYRSGNA